MNLYFPLITSAVAALDENSAESRRAIYERARSVLASQLKENPDLTELECEHERLALEEAIAECEAKAFPVSRESSVSNAAPTADEQEKPSLDEARPAPNEADASGAPRESGAAVPPKLIAPDQEQPGKSSDTEKPPSSEPAGDKAQREKPSLDEARPAPNEADASGAPRESGTAVPPKLIAPDQEQPGKSSDTERPPSSERDKGKAQGEVPVHPRLGAMVQAAQYHGVELDLSEIRHAPGETAFTASALSDWAGNAGIWSRAVRIRWRHLLRLHDDGPVVLLFTDGSAGLVVGADPVRKVVFLKDPSSPAGAEAVPVDELRLSEVWAGEAVLLRKIRGYGETDALFNFRWLIDLVLQERQSLRDIGLASLAMSVLSIFPPLLVMTTVNKVLQFHSISTLVLMSAMMVICVAYETFLGYARRLITSVVGARLDTKLNLHVFNRLLRLPLDYFERHPAGETMYKIAQVHKVREFLTGKLFATFLDLVTLCVLLPFLFYLNATLTWIVVACGVAITLIIFTYLGGLRVLFARVASAESYKAAALGETIVGIRTVKALALEPQRRAVWDERIAESGKWRLAFEKLANWPATLVTPIERMMTLGTMLIGAYIAINDPSGYFVGSLFAFMMLSQRVAQPLVGLARLVEDFEEVNAAIGEAASVLNHPLEAGSGAIGLRPKLIGAISFQDVTFTYGGSKVPALDRASFSIPAGTMLGVVGRSGSGKSTITRLLQGLNRDYRGFVKIDGSDLRDIDLRHLRQSFGVVLQSNFLFRGTVRDNIIAGRPGLTFADAVHAARLAGAEEFIERMPNGYETYIEEGSPNLSGGQCQRLAIARALIHDPRILILDEATSALDPESEAAVNENLLRIAHGRTMVIVSHRLSSLTNCDQILVMEEGKVADVGPHLELLERCSIYRQLWNQQNRHMEKSQGARHLALAPRPVPGG